MSSRSPNSVIRLFILRLHGLSNHVDNKVQHLTANTQRRLDDRQYVVLCRQPILPTCPRSVGCEVVSLRKASLEIKDHKKSYWTYEGRPLFVPWNCCNLTCAVSLKLFCSLALFSSTSCSSVRVVRVYYQINQATSTFFWQNFAICLSPHCASIYRLFWQLALRVRTHGLYFNENYSTRNFILLASKLSCHWCTYRIHHTFTHKNKRLLGPDPNNWGGCDRGWKCWWKAQTGSSYSSEPRRTVHSHFF